MTLMQKDREMKDAYEREEKLHRQNQKIRSQLDTLLKEQEKLVMQVLDLMKEKEQLGKDNKANQDQLDLEAANRITLQS